MKGPACTQHQFSVSHTLLPLPPLLVCTKHACARPLPDWFTVSPGLAAGGVPPRGAAPRGGVQVGCRRRRLPLAGACLAASCPHCLAGPRTRHCPAAESAVLQAAAAVPLCRARGAAVSAVHTRVGMCGTWPVSDPIPAGLYLNTAAASGGCAACEGCQGGSRTMRRNRP